MALAPSLPLFGVPSSSIITRSIPAWSVTDMPVISFAMTSLTFSTARCTPLPRYRSASASRSSTASRVPVDAPEGTAARPTSPSSR